MKDKLLGWLKRNRVALIASVLLWGLGLYMGWGVGGHKKTHDPSHSHTSNAGQKGKKKKKKTIWTCSMHPQIRMPKPGKCPICFMDLIPLTDDAGGQKNPRQIKLSQAGKILAQIRTSRVERRPVFLDVRMLGRVAYDETRIKSITAWVPGRLERLFVDYTGVRVRRGDHLVRIYSPELLAAQQELLQAKKAHQAAKRSKQRGLVLRTAKLALDSARRKLELLGLRRWQLQRILRRGKPSVRINIYAPMGGIVIHKKAMEGMYVKTGSHIYTIADLSQVWIKFDAYERDLPWLHVGQKVTFTTQATPGQQFEGKIVYIDPMLNAKTRTVSVRVNAKNPKGLLKPDMFVRGAVHVSVNATGRAQAPMRSGKWICPMHPEIVRKKRSSCSICGMRLERIVASRKTKEQDPLVIPATAPLLTGKRAVVYVEIPKTKKPTYEGREVTLGPRAGRFYVVLKGLKEGEKVVTQGAFRLDSELQLQARPSMMSADQSGSKKKELGKRNRVKVATRFIKKMKPLYEAYFSLQKALASDDPKGAKASYIKLRVLVQRRLSAKGPARMIWEKIRAQLYDTVKHGLKHKELAGQRRAFEGVSKAMIRLDQQIGHAGMKEYYLAYCPMAFNNRGANWLQQKKGILNPYFGSKMLQCGSIKQSFDGREGEPVRAPKRFLRRLSPLYTAYLTLQDHLFRDKYKAALKAAKELHKATKRSLHRYLPRRFRKRWRALQKALRKHSLLATKAKTIEALRTSFELLSKDSLQLLYIFGHQLKKPLFEAYCPMAFNNRGAAWIQSQDRKAHNAYFGAKMAYCGSIRRKFEARKK